MKISEINIEDLESNPWNPNVVDPINQDKLEASIRHDGLQKAILVRTLPSGKKQILDGQHRVLAATALGFKHLPCVDLGEITEGEAKKQTLIGNSRYGDDDPLLMANLLSDDSMGSAELLLSTLPFDEHTLTSYFEHGGLDMGDLDDLENVDDSDDLNLEMPPTSHTKTHQIMRFKVPLDDGMKISDLITKTKHEQGFTESDELTNAGDALVFILSNLEKNKNGKEREEFA